MFKIKNVNDNYAIRNNSDLIEIAIAYLSLAKIWKLSYSKMSLRKCNALSLKRKIDVIKAVDNCPPGKKRKQIADDFGIPPNTLTNIMKNREKTETAFYSGGNIDW